MKKEITYKLKLKQMNYIFDNSVAALVALLLMGGIIYYVLNTRVDKEILTLWSVGYFLILFYRLMVLVVYKRLSISESNISKFYWFYYVGLFLTGVMWGLIGIFMFPDELQYKILVIFYIVGLVSGSSATTAPRPEMFYTYLTISLVPYTYILISSNDEVLNIFAFGLILYILMTISVAKKFSQSVNSSMRLTSENESLIVALEEKIVEANYSTEAKSKFLSMMSHEIRTPLNAIIGFIKILKQNENDTDKLKYLGTVDKSSAVLLNVLNDILDIGKIESGKFNIERIDFDPEDEFTAMFALFEQSSKDQSVILINSISKKLPQGINCDKLRIKQVISNLLSNAIKFTPDGHEVELIIDFDTEKSLLNVRVRDTGIGIAKENINSILEEFTQADNSTARKFGGTGLGLSISNKLLCLMDAELKVESEIDVGSTFSFALPVERVDISSNDDLSNQNIDFNAKRVLVAEDNKTNQMLIEILLEELNLEVSIANDGVEAVDMYKDNSYDIVLMDINMPNKNGLEAMLDIRTYEKTEGAFTPIVALTANAISGDKEKYIQDGFDDYLPKPIDTALLTKILQRYIST